MIAAQRHPRLGPWMQPPGLGTVLDGARGLAVIWAVSCLGLPLLGAWFDSGRVELDFWDAVRLLLIDAGRLGPVALTSIAPLPVLSLVLLAGSAATAASTIGAGGIAVVALLLRRVGRSLAWLPLLVTQPAVLVAATHYPSVFLRAVLLLLVALALLAYLRRPATYYLLIAGLGLGGLAQVDQQSWPVWLYLAAVLLWARRVPGAERLALLLVLLFPAAFLSLARVYLQCILAEGFPGATTSSFDALPGGAVPALSGGLGDLISLDALSAVAYAVLALPLLARAARSARTVGSEGEGTAMPWLPGALILASPILDLLGRATYGRAWLPSLDAAFFLVAALVASAYDPARSH